MAEIKSTLDLIMEKTKHLSMDKEEKKAYKQEESMQSVRLAAVRFLNEERNADFLAREISRLPDEQLETAQGVCLNLFLERLSPIEDESRILTGVAKLTDPLRLEKWQQTIVELKTSAIEALEKIKADALAGAQNVLAAEGLQGTAVEPNLDENSPFLKEEKEALTHSFQGSLKKALTS